MSDVIPPTDDNPTAREKLHTMLQTLITSNNVYFQPPPSFKMIYPCVVYERSNGFTEFANNKPYKTAIRYILTLIDKDPDSLLLDKIMGLPECVYDRHFVVDGLNHDVFYLYY